MAKETVEINTPDPVTVGERTLRFTATEEIEDRSEDVIRVDGMEVESYRDNPIFLWTHDKWSLPVGHAVQIEKGDGELIIDVEFDEDEFSNLVFEKYKSGSLNMVSVSIIPGDTRDLDDGGFEFETSELIEVSAVTIGDNPMALIHREDNEESSDKSIADLAHAMINKALEYQRTQTVDKSFDGSSESVDKGQNLGNFIKLLILSEIGDDEPMTPTIDAIASTAGKSSSTVRSVLNGEIQCPDADFLEAAASVLRVEKEQLMTVAARDGCDFPVSEFQSEDDNENSDEDKGLDLGEMELRLKVDDETIKKLDTIKKEVDRLKNTIKEVGLGSEIESDDDSQVAENEVDPIEFEIIS